MATYNTRRFTIQNLESRVHELESMVERFNRVRTITSEGIREEINSVYTGDFLYQCRRIVRTLPSETMRATLLDMAYNSDTPVTDEDVAPSYDVYDQMRELENSGILNENFSLDYLAATPRGEILDLRRTNVQLQKLLTLAELSILSFSKIMVRQMNYNKEEVHCLSMRNDALKELVCKKGKKVDEMKKALNSRPRKRKFYDMEQAKKKIKDVTKKAKLLACPICRDKTVDLVLSCGHVICSDCCSQMKEETSDSIKCHTCRKISVPVPLHLG